MKKMAICMFILVWPLMAKAHGMDAMAYFNLGLKSTMTNKKIRYFSKALELNPLLTEAYEKRGMLYFFQEKYGLMTKDFKRFMELDSPKAKVLRMLGSVTLKPDFTRRLFPASLSQLSWSRNLPVSIPAGRKRIGLWVSTINPYAIQLRPFVSGEIN